MKSLKVIVSGILCVAFATAQTQNNQSLLTINGKQVPASYFEYIYKKNNSATSTDKKSLQEYLDLFTVFKLKVADAEAKQLDTLQSFKSELAGYRSQLTASYLTDTVKRNDLVMQEFKRMFTEINVSHILIKVENKENPNATPTPADTMAAYKKALEIEKRLKKEDFSKVAQEVSDDPSVKKNNGNLGYMSAMWLVYPFENMMYNTPKGQISKPFRTRFGYHILKVNDTRPARGKLLAAHIMLIVPDTATAENKAKAEEKIKMIYNKTKNGEDFAALAKEYSEDGYTSQNGGELSWFGTGNLVPEFEDAAFALTEKGQISEPVKSRFGWHIIKLLDKKPLDGFAEAKPNIERYISNSDMSEIVRNSFVNSLKKQYNFTLNKNSVAELDKIATAVQWKDSVFFVQANAIDKPLFSFADKSYTTKQFVDYMKQTHQSAATISNNIDNYVATELTNYKDKHLETEYPEFGNLMQEYHDGILLFDVSNREVWEKAATDTTGLQQYFAKNKVKYNWTEPHYKGRVLYCKDKKVANQVRKIIKTSPEDSINIRIKRLNAKDTVAVVKMEQKLFVKGENTAVDFYVFKEKNNFTPPAGFKEAFVAGKKLDQPESYADVKSAVVQDYQDYLEQEWVKALRKKYPVTVDEQVLNNIK